MEKYSKDYYDVLGFFESRNSPDIFENTREMGVVEYRQLFHTIMRKRYNKTYQEIASFCCNMGRKTNHSTIINSVKKTINTNYYAYDHIANIYDAYFQDKREERIAKLMAKQRKNGTNELIDLLNSIPETKVSEIRELVELRIQSWSWRGSND